MKKRVWSLCLAALLLASLLAGCGSNSSSTGAASTASTGEDMTNTAEPEAPANSGEVVNLQIAMYSFGTNVTDSDMVMQAINEYVEPLIGVNVDVEWIFVGDFDNQINLRLGSGQQIDLLPSGVNSITPLYNMDALLPLDDLLAQYGQGIISEVGETFIEACRLDGKLYSVPSQRAYAFNNGLIYRKDIAEQYNLDMDSVKTLDDLTEIFATLHEAEPGMDVLVRGTLEPMLNYWGWDALVDSYGVLMDPSSSEVSNLFESDLYRELVTKMYEWYQAGYIQKDAATSTESFANLMTSGNSFSRFMSVPAGELENQSGIIGYEFGFVELVPALATTASVKSSNWCIPVTTVDAEKAMQFLNLLYSDPVVANLFVYGIEGVHYQMIDEENNIAGYLDGEDATTIGYGPGIRMTCGNQFITVGWEGDYPGLFDDMREFNNSANRSAAWGFTYDSTPVTNQLTAIDTVVAKYRDGLETGTLNPATELDKFISELKAAGIDDVVAEKQSQLDAWLAS